MSFGTIDVSRTKSKTALARHHERALRGELARVAKPIPWDAFERGRYAEPALALAGDLFTKLAMGEYSAVGLFSQITAGLAFTGAPLDIVAASTRVGSDEIRHAEYCLRMAELCTGGPVSVRIEHEALRASVPAATNLANVDFLVFKYAAIGETLAAALLTECRRRATDPVTRALFGSLAADEVHHARLGWYYAAYRAPLFTLAERQELADRVAEFVMGIEEEFWFGRDAPRSARGAAKALGVLDSVTQRRVIADVVEGEILGALDEVGLGTSLAWRARRRRARA
ncbi:MAG TPA: ferritin-like domain-containing protein [Polyangiaceae bacterium]|nr:ferritin-like domain-containing protein [Polyangiaceae bacterium]